MEYPNGTESIFHVSVANNCDQYGFQNDFACDKLNFVLDHSLAYVDAILNNQVQIREAVLALYSTPKVHSKTTNLVLPLPTSHENTPHSFMQVTIPI